jgi:hypothetical protein
LGVRLRDCAPGPLQANFSIVDLVVEMLVAICDWMEHSICAFGHGIPETGWSVLPCSDPRRAQKMLARGTSGIFMEFCLLLSILLLWKPGMEHARWGWHEPLHISTLSLVRRSCVPGPVSKRMAYLVNVARYLMPFHNVYVYVYSLSSLPAPPWYFDVYTQRVHRSCPVYLRGCLSCCIWGACISQPVGADTFNLAIEEWTNKFQLDLEVRNIYYQDCKFFSLGVIIYIIIWYYHNLKMKKFMFSL